MRCRSLLLLATISCNGSAPAAAPSPPVAPVAAAPTQAEKPAEPIAFGSPLKAATDVEFG